MPFNFGRISSAIDSAIDNALIRGANAIAEDARANAPTGKIRANITVSPVENTPDGKKISVYVPLDAAPEARAYEYGSGIHATVDKPSEKLNSLGLIDIEAVNVPNLVFFWQREQKWFKGVKLPYGHPGVAAKPYLAPAVRRNTNTLKGLLSRALSAIVKAEIVTGFRAK